jgi:ABC-2 type transport system permease protein/lipopolysaccharide transport system permease protein
MTLVLKKQRSLANKQSIWSESQRYWQLLSVLVPQNLNTRYRGSFLGVYWSLLNPLIMTGLYTAIFGKNFVENDFFDSIPDYALTVFTGLLVINFYNSSTSQALTSIVTNGDLLNKMRLPLPVFPLSMIASNIFQFLVGSLPFLVIITIINSHNLGNIFLLLLPFLSLVLVCTGIGFFVSALFVFFRDLGYFYEIVCFIMWITSPVFYPAEMVEEGVVKSFLSINPLTPIMESLRDISLQGTVPDLSYTIRGFLGGLILLMLGWLFFRKLQSSFLDLL